MFQNLRLKIKRYYIEIDTNRYKYLMQQASLTSNSKLVSANKIFQSYRKSKEIIPKTPLQKSNYLSNKYNANIYLKRQDLQAIRSFKIRGAATAFRYLTEEQKQRGVVTASAGNHAQGIAYCCRTLKIKGTIFMPSNTPKLKINSVKHHGGDQYLTIILTGNTFDDAVAQAKKFQQKNNSVFIHAFDNLKVIEGQGGLAAQLLEEWNYSEQLDYVFTCVGGGGLASGLASYLTQMAPQVQLIGFEPLGSPSMYNSLKTGKPIILDTLQTFVDGASMRTTGHIPFQILNSINFELHLIHEGLIATTMLQMYDNEAIILQPAGSLAVSGLQCLKDKIVGKSVVCIISGSNNDISRLPQVRLRSKIYLEQQAYYVLTSPQSINLHQLITSIIDPEQNDIIFLNTAKKFNTSAGQCLIGVSFSSPQAKGLFTERVTKSNLKIQQLKANDPLLKILL